MLINPTQKSLPRLSLPREGVYLRPENWYTLTNKHNLSHSTLHRLKHNKDVSTKTLNDLCRILNCDIVRYIPSDTDQHL